MIVMSRIKTISAELARLLTQRVRERRHHVRVKYPPVGVIGDLPSVEVAGKVIVPINLSQAGILVRLDGKSLNFEEKIPVKIIWKYGPLIFNHEALPIRMDGDRVHLRFTKTDSRTFMEFSKSFDAGIRGAQVQKMLSFRTPSYLNEYWLGSDGEKVLFQKSDQGNTVDIFFMDHRIIWNTNQGLLREEKNERGEWHFGQAKKEVTDEVVIFLSNIVDPSERIQNLLKAIISRYYSAGG